MKVLKYFTDDKTVEDLCKEYKSLNEDTANQLKRTTWPRVRARVGRQKIVARYIGCERDGTLNFMCNSGTTPGKFWHQKVQFVDLANAIAILNKSFKSRKEEILQMLQDRDIKVWCDDLSWHYYFKYTAWKGGYGIEKELRPSRIRNPNQDRSLCKHLYAVMLLLPQINKQILRDYDRAGVFPSGVQRLKNIAKSGIDKLFNKSKENRQKSGVSAQRRRERQDLRREDKASSPSRDRMEKKKNRREARLNRRQKKNK